MCTVPTHGGGTRSLCALPPGPPRDCGSWPRSRSSPEMCAPLTQQRPTGFCCLRPSPCPGVPWTQLSQDWPLLCRLRGPGVYTAEGHPESSLTLWAAAVPPAAEQGPVQGWGRLGRPGRHGRSRGHSGAGHRACSVGGRAGSQSQGPWNRIVFKNVCVSARSGYCWCRMEATKGRCTWRPWCHLRPLGRGSAWRGPPWEAALPGLQPSPPAVPFGLVGAARPHSTCPCSL